MSLKQSDLPLAGLWVRSIDSIPRIEIISVHVVLMRRLICLSLHGFRINWIAFDFWLLYSYVDIALNVMTTIACDTYESKKKSRDALHFLTHGNVGKGFRELLARLVARFSWRIVSSNNVTKPCHSCFIRPSWSSLLRASNWLELAKSVE